MGSRKGSEEDLFLGKKHQYSCHTDVGPNMIMSNTSTICNLSGTPICKISLFSTQETPSVRIPQSVAVDPGRWDLVGQVFKGAVCSPSDSCPNASPRNSLMLPRRHVAAIRNGFDFYPVL